MMEREIPEGARVKGLYCGIPYTGTVVGGRGLTVPPYPIEYKVRLEPPVVMFGEAREQILVGNGFYYNPRHDREISHSIERA